MRLTRKHLRRIILKEMASMGMGMGGGSQLSDLIFHLTNIRNFLDSQGSYITRADPQLVPAISSMINGLQSGPSPGLINALKDMFLGGGFQYRSSKLDSMLAPVRSILSRM